MTRENGQEVRSTKTPRKTKSPAKREAKRNTLGMERGAERTRGPSQKEKKRADTRGEEEREGKGGAE